MKVKDGGLGATPNKLMSGAVGMGSKLASHPCHRHGKKLVLSYGAMSTKSCYVPLYFSALLTIHSISSFDKHPLSLVIVMQFDLPVILLAAETLKMPFASISGVTLLAEHHEELRECQRA